MKVSLEKVTPKKAQDWIKQNTNNRPVRQNVVDRYAAEMKRGDWLVNGETIKFNCDGRIADGQHRLYAVIASGATIESYIVREVPEAAFDTIDQGSVRKLSDVFARRGEASVCLLAAAVRWMELIRSGSINNKLGLTSTQGIELLEKNGDIRKSCDIVRQVGADKIIPGSVAAACHYLFSKKDKALADLFMEAIGKGEQLKRTDPAYVLRERLIQNKTSTSKIRLTTLAAFVVKAWNATRDGQPLRILKMAESESFPRIK